MMLKRSDRAIGAAAVAVGLWIACSSHHSTLQTDPRGTVTLYRLTRAEALQVAFHSLAETFPGREITPIKGPPPGFATDWRMLLDTYSQQVLVIAASGQDEGGQEFQGYYFEVSGSGSAVVSGRAKNADLFEKVEKLARQVGTAVKVTFWRVVADKPEPTALETPSHSGQSTPAERLRQLEEAFKGGLISKEEYDAKRAQILNEM